MTPRATYVVGGIVVAGIALWVLPGWLLALLLVALVAVPVAGYLMLSPSQRRRLARRRQLPR